MRAVIRHLVAGALAVIVFPALCFAQFGTIAGVVKDSSGAVLPGVTVEAASPALIEKTRTAVSDSAGQYSVQQLRPGVYTVTFTLTGFSTVRREGIEISAGFVAPVNASLKVGAVAETITVTGQAPVVDVQSSSERKQLPKEALDALPTARSFATLGTTLPGVTANQRDVGGTQGERGNVLAAHGGTGFDMTVQIDGIAIGNLNTGVNFRLGVVELLAQRRGRPGDGLRNRGDFHRSVEWRRPGERGPARGRQPVQRVGLRQFFEPQHGAEQSHPRAAGAQPAAAEPRVRQPRG